LSEDGFFEAIWWATLSGMELKKSITLYMNL